MLEVAKVLARMRSQLEDIQTTRKQLHATCSSEQRRDVQGRFFSRALRRTHFTTRGSIRSILQAAFFF